MNISKFVRRLTILVSFALVAAAEVFAAPATSLAANAPPTISGFTPKSGPVGTLVTINGKHFGAPAPGLQVLFNGTLATPETVVANQITVRVPPLATTGRITVKTRYGTAMTSSAFRVTRGIASFPRGAWPGQSITIAGSGFAAFHDLTLQLDGAPIGGVGTNANGAFTMIHALPPTISTGANHILLARDSITHVQQQIHIWIFGGWPQPRNDEAQSGNGAAEFLINTSNVSKVKFHYATSPFTSPVVEDGGNVYVGEGIGPYLAQFDPWGPGFGTIGWGGAVDGNITQAPAVANGVVYAVTDDLLYAFVENPASSAQLLWTAELGDSAHPFAPVVADGRVYVADGGLGLLQVFDANGVTNCSGSPKVCTPLWFASYTTVFGPPAIDAKSAGGSGDVYLSVRTTGGVNKVVVKTGAGAVVGQSAGLATTSLSGPSFAADRVMVSGWSAGSSTATVYALDASSQALLWNSTSLGGSSAPTAVAVAGGKTFVQDSDGTLHAFKNTGCGTAVCSPAWSSGNYGTGGTTPPTIANGVVYIAAGPFAAPFNDEAYVVAFDAGSGAELAMVSQTGINSQITVVAGTVLTFGHDNLSIAEIY